MEKESTEFLQMGRTIVEDQLVGEVGMEAEENMLKLKLSRTSIEDDVGIQMLIGMID